MDGKNRILQVVLCPPFHCSENSQQVPLPAEHLNSSGKLRWACTLYGVKNDFGLWRLALSWGTTPAPIQLVSVLNLSQWIHLYTSKLVGAYFFQQEYSLCKLSSLLCHTSLGFEVSHKQRTERCFWTNVIASEVMSFRVTSVKEKENTTTVL